MRSLKQASLGLVVALFLSVSCFGQESSAPPRVGVSVSEILKRAGKAEAVYTRSDYGEDFLMASVYVPKVYEGRKDSYDMVALFRVPGSRVVIKPDVVSIHFNSEHSFEESHNPADGLELRIKVDNEKWLDLGRVRLVQEKGYSWGKGVASVDFQTYARIASGKKVRIKLGGAEFRLSPEHLEALRDLTRLIEPGAKNF